MSFRITGVEHNETKSLFAKSGIITIKVKQSKTKGFITLFQNELCSTKEIVNL